MKLDFVQICGFRGFRDVVRVDFSKNFTIIDGPNGAGKSTIFDAVEYALTGTISKYLDAKASGESVDDYIWWAGEGKDSGSLSEHFVRVGFYSGDKHYEIRRTPLDPKSFCCSGVTDKLIDTERAPKQAITQLCASTIIRDEHIARLSLDLKEGDRFRLLRDAIGAIDAETWIARSKALHKKSAERLRSAQRNVSEARSSQASAQQLMDQARASRPDNSVLSQAVSRLQSTLDINVPIDQLSDAARRRLADLAKEFELVRSAEKQFEHIRHVRNSYDTVERKATQAIQTVRVAKKALDVSIAAIGKSPASTALSKGARQIEKLVELGRNLGLRNGHCPLCESEINETQFSRGARAALSVARQIDSQAVSQAKLERVRDDAKAAFNTAEKASESAIEQRDAVKQTLREFDELLDSVSLVDASQDKITYRIAELDGERQAIASDLRLIDTHSLDQAVMRASKALDVANERVSNAEARLGRARIAEARAKSIFDATRRAAAETLDERLDRVLPLMSELYQRLRPHPVWDDIEYRIRGDVQRFLRLQVGRDINPQFVFSSGQRRATGLAFLLSINLSIAWSRWRSILLDDPVQHIDDFRAVHLAEVLYQLCQSGLQVICAVEDRALADLMCRRLPTSEASTGRRFTFGVDQNGALGVTHQQEVTPHKRRVLVVKSQSQTA